MGRSIAYSRWEDAGIFLILWFKENLVNGNWYRIRKRTAGVVKMAWLCPPELPTSQVCGSLSLRCTAMAETWDLMLQLNLSLPLLASGRSSKAWRVWSMPTQTQQLMRNQNLLVQESTFLALPNQESVKLQIDTCQLVRTLISWIRKIIYKPQMISRSYLEDIHWLRLETLSYSVRFWRRVVTPIPPDTLPMLLGSYWSRGICNTKTAGILF